MTRKHAKELLPIITAYAEGKTIEYKCNGNWAVDPVYNFQDRPDHYRIKPDPDPYAELKAAHAARKAIQMTNNPLAEYPDWHDVTWDLRYGASPDCYRIKPTPKLVPLTSDDLPPVVWVRRAICPDVLFSVLILQSTQFYCAAGLVFVENWPLWEWSPDRKTWHSFMKEVEE